MNVATGMAGLSFSFDKNQRRIKPTGTTSPATAGRPQASSDIWKPLFDGEHLAGWRGFRQDDVPPGWTMIAAGELHATGEKGPDLITTKTFADSELSLEWKLAEDGNRGILFRATEDHVLPWMTGPEMQLLDDARHPNSEDPETRCGANYLLHAPRVPAARPVGSYNEARILAVGPHVEYRLNGQLVVRSRVSSSGAVALRAFRCPPERAASRATSRRGSGRGPAARPSRRRSP